MVEVNVHSDIASEKEGQWMAIFGMENAAFSLDTVKRIFANNPDETEFTFNYHCDGGSVSEGFAIYDFIRTSGKTIHSNIEGDCHSMAVVLMLAGAKELRRANPLSSALLHEIRGGVSGTAEEIREYADYMDAQTEKMLDIYADRTGHDRAELEVLLKEEKVRTPEELLQYGFISKINPYTTNMAKKTQKELTDLLSRGAALLGRLTNFLEPKKPETPETYDFLDAEGAFLFTVNRADDQIQLNDVASPDGAYTFEDGRVVTVEGGVITNIAEAPIDPPAPEEDELENLRNQVAEAAAREQELRNQLQEAQALIVEQQEVIQSDYVPKARVVAPAKPANRGGKTTKTVEELKDEVRQKREKTTNKN